MSEVIFSNVKVTYNNMRANIEATITDNNGFNIEQLKTMAAAIIASITKQNDFSSDNISVNHDAARNIILGSTTEPGY